LIGHRATDQLRPSSQSGSTLRDHQPNSTHRCPFPRRSLTGNAGARPICCREWRLTPPTSPKHPPQQYSFTAKNPIQLPQASDPCTPPPSVDLPDCDQIAREHSTPYLNFPRVPSLEAFGRRPPKPTPLSRRAVIRNPAQTRTSADPRPRLTPVTIASLR
jgi:hypothetical protein